jgi:hypothetical protein
VSGALGASGRAAIPHPDAPAAAREGGSLIEGLGRPETVPTHRRGAVGLLA